VSYEVIAPSLVPTEAGDRVKTYRRNAETAISPQTATYNANDQTGWNGCDSNGNTLTANGKTFAYDSFDRMTSFGGGTVKMVYDGDGTRVAKTVGGVTTQYLVDDLNPTGLPQVAEESVGGVVQRTYLYGLERISQTQVKSGTTSYYGYDAHGDVRFLTDRTGAVTDTYDYDAFGNIVGSTGTTPNVYRYQGEALDAETGLYFLRARYYDPTVGRFLNVDPMADEGEHPYTYAGADPVNGHDPTGRDVIDALILAYFMPPLMHVPRLPNMISCVGGIAFSGMSAVELMAKMLACQLASSPRKGPAATGGGSQDPKPTYLLVIADCYYRSIAEIRRREYALLDQQFQNIGERNPSERERD
jgi:RHS repeat-associated protein